MFQVLTQTGTVALTTTDLSTAIRTAIALSGIVVLVAGKVVWS